MQNLKLRLSVNQRKSYLLPHKWNCYYLSATRRNYRTVDFEIQLFVGQVNCCTD